MAQNSNSSVSPSSLITASFKQADNALKSGNNSVQQMAAGIMLYHAEHHTSERGTFEAVSQRTEAFKQLKEELVKEFVTPRLTDKSKNAAGQTFSIDAVTKANRTNATQMVALNKGFDLAIALHACNVTSASFDASLGLFSVPVSVLLPRNDAGDAASPVGQLRKLADGGLLVKLDGASYRAELDDKMVSFNAFPAHFLAVAGYKKTKKTAPSTNETRNGASDTSTNGGGAASDTRANVTTWSLEAAAAMIAKLADHISGVMATEKAVPYSEWPVELCNAISELNVMRDDALAAQGNAKAA